MGQDIRDVDFHTLATLLGGSRADHDTTVYASMQDPVFPILH